MAIVASPDGLFDNEGTATSPYSLDRGLQELAILHHINSVSHYPSFPIRQSAQPCHKIVTPL
jgi:hypothetical protein